MKLLFKRRLIIFAVLLAIFLCLFLAIKLLSVYRVYNIGAEKENGANASNALRVIDGDTFEFLGGEIVRLICVDTPEEGKEGYEEAKDYLSSLVFEGEEDIKLEREGIDKYNRTLAWVYLVDNNSEDNKILINKEIINNDFGVIFPYNGTNCSKIE